jgi:hypothetical protein
MLKSVTVLPPLKRQLKPSARLILLISITFFGAVNNSFEVNKNFPQCFMFPYIYRSYAEEVT